ncbi:MAG: hypothetical protein AAGU11_13430 [Syntrophobacteraceae bacterium]
MNRSTQWLSLIAGLVIFGYGVAKLFSEHDWVLFILGLLIVGFSISKMVKSKAGGNNPPGRRR